MKLKNVGGETQVPSLVDRYSAVTVGSRYLRKSYAGAQAYTWTGKELIHNGSHGPVTIRSKEFWLQIAVIVGKAKAKTYFMVRFLCPETQRKQ